MRIHTQNEMGKIYSNQASNSETCGKIRETLPRETGPCHSSFRYGVAKTFRRSITVNCRESYRAFAASRIFDNDGSNRRGHELVTRMMIRTVAKIILGPRETIALANLDASRELYFGADMAAE